MIPGAIILGIIGGCLGPFFINVNTRVNVFRKKILKHKWMLPLETAFFCFFTASVFFWAPYYVMREDCISKDALPNTDEEFFHNGWCKSSDTYNPLATLLWASES